MALNTEISWCDHTLNLWWGCFKVSPGCKHCYADTLDNRYNHGNRSWGQNAGRKLVRSWKKNLNEMRKSAISHNRRETVFVMSMGDIFEDEKLLTNNFDTNWLTTNDVKQEFFSMIPQYPELIFLLLTKRPENIGATIPHWWDDDPPFNVWFGTSIVNQEEVHPRISAIALQSPSWNIFVSMEPLLGAVTLDVPCPETFAMDSVQRPRLAKCIETLRWIIVGGESGQNARPMNPDWAITLRDEARYWEVPFHFKQWGEYDQWGQKVGKKAAGNILDGEVLQAFPPEFHTPIKAEVTL